MPDISSNSRRIAKNTLLLYMRTLFIMFVTLYTSRVVLNTLGVEDYGVYNVVGGVVAMFSVVSGSLSSSISRFITYELGHGDYERLNRIFSTSVNIQVGISLIVFVLAETFGVWFLNTNMNIPAERMTAANWVLQCSLLVFMINLISVPYNACIIAHEKMSAFAYISILETILKLIVVYMLLISPYDKLATYSVLLVVVALVIRMVYGQYCRLNFKESRYRYICDWALIREMTGFAGWSFFGNGAYILNTQGLDLLINIFFGVTLNAARGIATQVQNAVMQFVNNFTVAVNPQIMKSYASGNMTYMFNLVCSSSKFSFFLLLIFVVPIICDAGYILKLWLHTIPLYAPEFLKLALIGALTNVLGVPMQICVSATGKIKTYQLWVTLIGSLVFVVTWIAFKCGYPAIAAYVSYIIIFFILIFVRLELIKRQMGFPDILFIKNVMAKIIPVSITSFILPILIVCSMNEGFLRLLILTVVSISSTAASIYYIGCNKDERIKLATYLKKRLASVVKSLSRNLKK